MRILLLNHGYQGGGAERCVRELHHGLRQRGHDVQVWIANPQDNLPQDVHPITKPWEQKLLPLDMLADLTDWRHRGSIHALSKVTPDQFDLLHIHSVSGGWMSLNALSAACNRVPSVWSHHDEWALTDGFICDLNTRFPKADALRDSNGLSKWIGRSPYHDNWKNRHVGKLLDHAAPRQPVMIAPSQYLLNMIRQCPRFTHSQSVQIYHGVSMLAQPAHDTKPAREMDQRQARQAWNIPADRPVVLMVAAHLHDVHKGIRLGIDAIRKLPASTRPVVFLLGKNAQSLQHHLSDLQVVTGYAANATTLASAYRAADVTLVPSLSESLSFVCLESLACHRPIVTFNVGGPGEIVGHNERGLASPPYDVDQLAAHLQSLLTSPAQRDQLATVGRSWVETHCNMAAYLDQIEAVYRTAIDRRPAANPTAKNTR